jgi:hypothetical protein
MGNKVGRPSRAKQTAIQQAIIKARRDYIYGIFINNEFFYPTLEGLVTRYKNAFSITKLQNTARKEGWTAKRQQQKLATRTNAPIDIPDADSSSPVDTIKNLSQVLLIEALAVEKARIAAGDRRSTKELADISKFLKTMQDVVNGAQVKHENPTLIINNITQEFKHLYPNLKTLEEGEVSKAREIFDDDSTGHYKKSKLYEIQQDIESMLDNDNDDNDEA